ncbi:hypothetical protein DCC39_07970 [Pueribacillus theae]|uniref:Uncharacterized protein n=1 Tax=Pueribacillus theae TaxID=2171751 RepID=A0A2U1K3H3_9BACI|nr:hypothetical protein [Pueribacillus theae]PWA12061.1 hypothetical protein DCC39_07970 [Pueribacillus theae]
MDNDKLDLILSELKNIKSEQERHSDLLHQLIKTVGATNTKLESTESNVHRLHDELSSLKQGQERQDKILESLAMRSLEQETELRDLKRIK